jgi:hypothetical protein
VGVSVIDGSLVFGVFTVVFSAFAGFGLEGGFLVTSGASFSDFLEFVLERFGGGEASRAGEAARLRAGMLRDLGPGAFSAGWAGLAEAARADRLGGIAERRKKSQQGLLPLASAQLASHVTRALLIRICSLGQLRWQSLARRHERQDGSDPAHCTGCCLGTSPKTHLHIYHTQRHCANPAHRLLCSADSLLAKHTLSHTDRSLSPPFSKAGRTSISVAILTWHPQHPLTEFQLSSQLGERSKCFAGVCYSSASCRIRRGLWGCKDNSSPLPTRIWYCFPSNSSHLSCRDTTISQFNSFINHKRCANSSNRVDRCLLPLVKHTLESQLGYFRCTGPNSLVG